MKPILFLLALLLAAPSRGPSQTAPQARSPADNRPPQARPIWTNTTLRLQSFNLENAALRAAAKAELAAHLPLVTPETYKELGLASVEQAAQLRLGEPMMLYEVKVESLEAALAGGSSTLPASRQVLFPLEVDRGTLAALVLEKSFSSWEGVRFGWPRTARQLAQFRQEQSSKTGLPAAAFAVVEVAPLRFSALAFTREGRLMFVPTRVVPGARFEAGKPRPAAEILAELLPQLRQWMEESRRTRRPTAR